MAEFTLQKREADTLKLNIGDDSFEIPLATSLTLEEASSVDTREGAIDFFKKYIREDVANTMTLRDYIELIFVWRDESKKFAEGLGPGESQASHG